MASNNTTFILTDIEGTTTSVSFVYEILFPYFRNNIQQLKDLQQLPEVHEAFEQTIELTKELEGIQLIETDDIINKLLEWSLADKKITPLKTLQGILWENGYKSGEIKGHVYPEVKENLEKWKRNGIHLGVFSSGSVAAQKLIFGYSELGDLTPNFTYYFDTKTGGKREVETYTKISKEINITADSILFLSDIVEELEAAKLAGFQTIQLVREGTTPNWENVATSFDLITKYLEM
jgi:enolase-phosphatase E1